MCTHNLYFEQKYERYQKFSTENFPFLQFKISVYIGWTCFRNEKLEAAFSSTMPKLIMRAYNKDPSVFARPHPQFQRIFSSPASGTSCYVL